MNGLTSNLKLDERSHSVQIVRTGWYQGKLRAMAKINTLGNDPMIAETT
jgi:hypothetical protein